MKEMVCKATVLNVRDGITERYIVATLVDGELWFWGAYDDLDRAEDARKENSDFRVILINGEVKK